MTPSNTNEADTASSASTAASSRDPRAWPLGYGAPAWFSWGLLMVEALFFGWVFAVSLLRCANQLLHMSSTSLEFHFSAAASTSTTAAQDGTSLIVWGVICMLSRLVLAALFTEMENHKQAAAKQAA